jgi:hypothetical protein
MNITWKISQLERRAADGFVTTAHWSATAVDGEFTANIYATASWADGQPSVPYEALTEQQVLDWVWASGVDKAAAEQTLADQIAAQKAPVTVSGTPWSA